MKQLWKTFVLAETVLLMKKLWLLLKLHSAKNLFSAFHKVIKPISVRMAAPSPAVNDSVFPLRELY